MDVAILGTGNVGSALGKRWAAQGHTVVFGSRDPSSPKVQALVQATAGRSLATGGKNRATTPREAVAGASIVLLAIPFHSTQEILAGLDNLAGKILIDATNPLGPGMKLIICPDSSAAEQIAVWAKGALVVKAFNITGSGNMADAGCGTVRPAILKPTTSGRLAAIQETYKHGI